MHSNLAKGEAISGRIMIGPGPPAKGRRDIFRVLVPKTGTFGNKFDFLGLIVVYFW